MIENYDHYISRSIQSVYRRKLAAPFIYIILLAVLWLVTPLSHLLFPRMTVGYDGIVRSHDAGNRYIEIELSELYFTGYTSNYLGQVNGYFYYTMKDDTCIFVLLSPNTSEQGLPFIENAVIRGKILDDSKSYQKLAEALSKDLSWTALGLSSKVSPYLISEPRFHSLLSVASLGLFFASGIYAFLSIIVYILFILFPVLSPPCRQLGRFGKPSELLAQAEEELATLPQLATEDMFITEHFFIEIADFGIAVVPIEEILWIYKYSTLHKLFWYHFNISYTLHITANRHLYLQCPKNRKSDIDGIIDYLSEANHNILVGFNEKNRLKIQELQGKPMKFMKVLEFFRRKF